MNNKIIAAIVIIIVIVAVVGAGAYFFLHNKDKNNDINVLAAVNTEGSGIYIKSDINPNDMFDFSETIPVAKASGWVGKIIATPGAATIQQVQLITLIDGMGLKYSVYNLSTYNPNTTDTVYIYQGVANASMALNDPAFSVIDGGILWQPQYQIIVDTVDASGKTMFHELALTNDLFPGHSCCVIAGNNNYVSSHQDDIVNFLAAYVHAVNWVNDAKAPDSANHAKLIEIAMDAVGANAPGSTITQTEIEEAIATVTYTYGADGLAKLTSDIANLSQQMVDINQTSGVTLSDLGFDNGTEFADKFVDNSYLAKAVDLEGKGLPSEPSSLTNLSVAVISGDLHQLAVHVAVSLGFFKDYGLNVTLNGATNGPGVATAIQNGNSALGLLGAPPITITVISGELVTA